MNTLAYIRHSLELSRTMVLGLLDDMKDAPLQTPTSSGGNHPLWILGHVTYAEANIVEHIIKGNDNPLLEWKATFSPAQEPSEVIEDYPAWDEIRSKFDEVRQNTLAYLDSITENDLDNKTVNPPPGREQVFGTVAACCLMMTMHPLMHYGQVADARRMLGRAPLFR